MRMRTGVHWHQLRDARRRLHLHARLHAADEDAGLSALLYPRVPISLHAGELAPGLVPPEGLRFHIRQAVELGHAQRIGHGVDVMYEDDAPGLLKELAQKHVMVEINLSSNEGILGIKGDEHPFPIYRAAHVPVALSTDDEGVSRIELTHEYVRAALDYNLTYQDLKQLARTGMEHNFLPGQSLWAAPESEKAAAQWELERRLSLFEAKWVYVPQVPQKNY
jgi:adenosine deaminase